MKLGQLTYLYHVAVKLIRLIHITIPTITLVKLQYCGYHDISKQGPVTVVTRTIIILQTTKDNCIFIGHKLIICHILGQLIINYLCNYCTNKGI